MTEVQAADGSTNTGITVPPDQTITGSHTTNSLIVNEGGKLTIDSGSYLGVSSSNGEAVFINAGEIIAKGTINFDSSMSLSGNTGSLQIGNEHAENFSLDITPQQLSQLIEKGTVIIGGDDLNNRVRVATHGDDFETNLFSNGDSFKSAQGGELVIKKWGRLRSSSNTLVLHGNELSIGGIKYNSSLEPTDGESDITDTDIPQIVGSKITILPDPANNGSVTITSGLLRIGNGVDPSSTNPDLTRTAHLTIGQPTNINGNEVYNSSFIIDGGAVALGSGGNANGGGIVNGSLEVGKAASTDESLLFVRAGNWIVKGNVTLNKNGLLKVGGGYSQILGDLESRLRIENKFLMTGGVLEVTGLLNLIADGGIEGSQDVIWNVPQGTLQAEKIELRGGQINFDPPFIAVGDTSNASLGGLSFVSSNIDARMNIGRNSMVTIGSTDPEWLRTKIDEYQAKNNLLWGKDITAALALRSPQTLSPLGGINVDGTWVNGGAAAAANTATFADKSLFVIDAAGMNGSTALSGNGTASLEVSSGAKLLVTDAAAGDVIRVTDDFASSDIKGWSAENLATSTDLQTAVGEIVDPATGEYVVRITDGKSVAVAFPNLSPEMTAVVAQANRKGLDTNSAAAGTRFISRAVDNRYLGSNDAMLASATMESAARMTVAGAVPQMALAANNAAGAAITQRTSFAQPDGIIQAVDANGDLITAQERFARNFALWIMPLYQSTNGFGMEAGDFNYDFNGALGGVALGADYTFDNMLRLGVAFNIGGGYAQGSGDLNKTTNNMNFWGIGAYAGWAQNNFGLTADVNYTSTYNKLKQELPELMQMKDLKGDVTAWALSAGLRAEYRLETEMLDIIPHVGFRFINLNVDSYDIKSNGTVINGDSYSQNIWTFPIGVSFSKKYSLANGWAVKPLLDLNVTPATGDFNAKSTVRFTGINQEAELETQMMDYITYGGTAGIEFGNETVSFGVNYNGQFGAESSAHGVFGTFRLEF